MMAQGSDAEFNAALAKIDKPTRGAISRELRPDPVAEAGTRVVVNRLREEVHALAKLVTRLAQTGDAPSSLALFLAAPR